MFKKELVEKRKNLDQLRSMCYEEGDGHVSSGSGTDVDNVDDDNTNKSLNLMITDFETLMSKKNMMKDNVTNIKVNNIQVATLQSLMAPQSLVMKN